MPSATHQFATLRPFYARARRKDRREAVFGQRVQTIKPHESHGWSEHERGTLEFGIGVPSAAGRSQVAPLGASPTASIAFGELQCCLDDSDVWGAKVRGLSPISGIDPDACRETRVETAPVLRIEAV